MTCANAMTEVSQSISFSPMSHPILQLPNAPSDLSDQGCILKQVTLIGWIEKISNWWTLYDTMRCNTILSDLIQYEKRIMERCKFSLSLFMQNYLLTAKCSPRPSLAKNPSLSVYLVQNLLLPILLFFWGILRIEPPPVASSICHKTRSR